MASNTQKSQKRNRIEMIGSAAANTFTNAAVVALFASPALAINPTNIPAPEARTTSLKLVAKNPTSSVPKPHTPQGNASEYQILVKKGDRIGELELTFLLGPSILGIDNNGNVLYGANTDKGFAYFRNREVVWYAHQEINGFKTGSGSFSRASITPEGDTYISLGGIRDEGTPQQKPGYIVLHNGQVAFDSTTEVSDVIDISTNPQRLGLVYDSKTGHFLFRYLTQPQGGGAWQSHEKILGTSPVYNKYTGASHFHAPQTHLGFYVYEPIESQNGKHAAFYGYDEAGYFVATMGGKAIVSHKAQEPKIYDIFVGGFFANFWGGNIKKYMEKKFANRPDIICTYHAWDDENGILHDINTAPKNAIVRVIGHSYGGDTSAKVVGEATHPVDTLILVDPVSRIKVADYPNPSEPKISRTTKPLPPTWIQRVTERIHKAKNNVTGQFVVIDAMPGENEDFSDNVAYIGGKWDKLPDGKVDIFILDPGRHHTDYIEMVEDQQPQLGGKSLIDLMASPK